MTCSTRHATHRLGTLAIALLASCGGDEASTPDRLGVPLLMLGEPSLEIGTVDGPEQYAFTAIETVLRLPDGRVAVSDAGATLIQIFEESGEHVVSWGTSGDGPGEFNSLSRLYSLGGDSLMAAERYSGRLSVFDLRGNFGRLIPGQDLSGDSIFTLDSWLYRRFWVDGALTSEDRRDARAVLDDLPIPREAPGYRVVFRGDDGALWLKEPDRTDGFHFWTRIDSSGSPTGVLSLPARFSPTQFGLGEVLGVWRGESDIHFVRAYPFESDGDQMRPVQAWLRGDQFVPSATEGPAMEEVMTVIRGTIRQMATAQEIHYSTHMSYTDAVDSLDAFEMPDELWIDFIKGDARGWAGVFAHNEVNRICGLAYGYGAPAGWAPGRVACAPQVVELPTRD